MDSDINQLTTKLNFEEYSQKLKKVFPDLDMDFLIRFGTSMLMLHKLVVLTEKYFQTLGTSKGRFIILIRLIIVDSPQGESISELRLFYPISYASMSGVLDTLEKDGMIERLPNPSDRRKVNVRITDAGRKFMTSFMPEHVKNIKQISCQLSDQDRVIFLDIVQKIITGFEKFLCSDADKSASK